MSRLAASVRLFDRGAAPPTRAAMDDDDDAMDALFASIPLDQLMAAPSAAPAAAPSLEAQLESLQEALGYKGAEATNLRANLAATKAELAAEKAKAAPGDGGGSGGGGGGGGGGSGGSGGTGGRQDSEASRLRRELQQLRTKLAFAEQAQRELAAQKQIPAGGGGASASAAPAAAAVPRRTTAVQTDAVEPAGAYSALAPLSEKLPCSARPPACSAVFLMWLCVCPAPALLARSAAAATGASATGATKRKRDTSRAEVDGSARPAKRLGAAAVARDQLHQVPPHIHASNVKPAVCPCSCHCCCIQSQKQRD